jgi:quercetin dioxygenase-like cupin family protein
MANLFDELQMGTVSRRRLLQLLSAGCSAAIAAAQTDGNQPKPSPANIGGGGRIERNFYREWIKTTKVPMAEGYSILDASKQEVRPWPEIGGRGLYLNFSGNVHMDAVIHEIPPGKALEPTRHFYEQVTYVLSGRGHSIFGSGGKGNKIEWAEGSLFAVPMNVLHRHYNGDSVRPARLLFSLLSPSCFRYSAARASSTI